MDKQEIEVIRSVVIFGLYRMCLMNRFDSTIFGKFKDKQNRLFDNYMLNRKLLEESKLKM